MESGASVQVKAEPRDEFVDDRWHAHQSSRPGSIAGRAQNVESWHAFLNRRPEPLLKGKLPELTLEDASNLNNAQPEDLSAGRTMLKTSLGPALNMKVETDAAQRSPQGGDSGRKTDNSSLNRNSPSVSSPLRCKGQGTMAGRNAADQQRRGFSESASSGEGQPSSLQGSEADANCPTTPAIKQEPDSSSYEWQASTFNHRAPEQAEHPLHHHHQRTSWTNKAAWEKGRNASKPLNKLRIKLADVKTEPETGGDLPAGLSGTRPPQVASDLTTRNPPARGSSAEQNCIGGYSSSRGAAVGVGGGEEHPGDEEEMDALPVHFPPAMLNGNTGSSQHRTNAAAAATPAVTSDASKPAADTTKYYQCGICLQAFEAPVQLKNHMTWHITSGLEKPIRCGACAKRFRYCSDLIQHSVVHTGERNHRCEECQATFTKASSLKEHAKTHTGERPFKCDECAAEFKHSSHLKAHRRIHTGEKPYQCDVCQVFFTSRSYLKLHRRIHTGDRRFKCGQCSAEFNQALHLETHMRVHTGEKPFRCEMCGLTYRYKSSLKSHIFKAHCTEKPYKCPSCPAAFTSPEALRTHCKTHECGGKPFKCNECSSTFLSSAGLYQHKWIHTGEKPFKCDFCPAAFRDSTTLKRHKVIHMGERPFKCEHCCASFKLLTHLSCHAKIHSETGSLETGEGAYKNQSDVDYGCEEALNLSLKVEVGGGRNEVRNRAKDNLLGDIQGGNGVDGRGGDDARSLSLHAESDEDEVETGGDPAFKMDSDDGELGENSSIRIESDVELGEDEDHYPISREIREQHVEKECGSTSNLVLS